MESPLIGSGQINYLTMTASGEGAGTGVQPAPRICNFHPALDVLTSALCVVMTWYAFQLFFDMEYDSTLASVMLLVLGSWACGKIAGMLYLPPLLGMLLAGMVLRNTGHYSVDVKENVFQHYICNLRSVRLRLLFNLLPTTPPYHGPFVPNHIPRGLTVAPARPSYSPSWSFVLGPPGGQPMVPESVAQETCVRLWEHDE